MKCYTSSVLFSGLGILGLSQSVAAQAIPDYYVGAGVRAFLNDPTSIVIDSKVKITTMGDFTLSTRPAVMFGDGIVESRLPITVEVPLGSSFYPYAGLGLAHNADGTNNIDPMLTGGTDIRVSNNIYIDANLNLIYQTAIDDLDAEVIFTVNYGF